MRKFNEMFLNNFVSIIFKIKLNFYHFNRLMLAVALNSNYPSYVCICRVQLRV